MNQAKGVTLVGGAPVPPGALEAALARAPRLVAADGGADAALAAGLAPERVVGDMDSISPEARAAFAGALLPVAEQDSTDLAKALRLTEAPFFLGVGFLGARVDHGLAALTVLAARAGARAAPCVLLGSTDCLAVAPPQVALDLVPGTRVSLWPMGPARGTSRGLHWPIDGIDLSPAGRVGTSNRADGPVRLRLEGAPVMLILPVGELDALLAGLGIRAAP